MKKIIKKVSFRIIRKVHDIKLRNLLCSILKLFLPKKEMFYGNNILELKNSEEVIFQDLKNNGFSDLGIVLNDTMINKILIKLKDLKCYDLDKKDNLIVNLNNVDNSTQLANYKREDLVQISEILQIANDSRILNAVSNYLGIKPTISNINCWWSFGNRKEAKEAQFFHRDIDDYKFVKIFFYLTDVNIQNGPHIFVKGSHKLNKLIQLRRFKDGEVNDNFDSKNILTLTGSKGSSFIEDTYGIHKGQLPLEGKRLLLQIEYSYLPLHVEEYSPQKIDNENKYVFDNYINRLIVKE